MSGKFLIILGAGPDQIPAYREARRLGIRTVGVDYNQQAPAFQYADQTIIASVKDVQETIRALRNAEMSYAGVMTLGVEISPVVAAVAGEFGLVSVSGETAHLTTNKCARSRCLQKAGIPIPGFQEIQSVDEATFPFPFVIKPSDNSASRGVSRVDTPDDLRAAFPVAKAFASDGKVLIEELMKGPEISIEGFMLNGRMQVTGFGDRNYSRNVQFYPYFVEDGGDHPSALPPEVKEEAAAVFERAAQALGIQNGPSKGDLIVTDRGVRVIEITSRLSGGGFCSRIVPLQNGVNIVAATIRWACGMPVERNAFLPGRSKHVSHRFFFHNPGRIKAIAGLEKVKDMPGITDVVIQRPFRVGDILEPVSYANRLFYVIAVADDRETAIRYAEDAIGSVRIEVE